MTCQERMKNGQTCSVIRNDSTTPNELNSNEFKECNHKTFSHSVIIVSSVLLFILPLYSVIVIKLNNFNFSNGASAAYGLLILSYAAAQISILIILRRGFNRRSDAEKNEPEKVLQAHMLIHCFMVILAIGDSLVNLTRFGDYAITLANGQYSTYDEYIFYGMVMAENLFKWYHHLFLLLIIIYNKELRSALDCFWVKLFIGSLAFSCLMQWIFIVFIQIDNEYEGNENQVNVNLNTNSSQYRSFKAVEPFLYPAGIEFRIMCCLEFASIALTSNDNPCVQSFMAAVKAYVSKKAKHNSTVIIRPSNAHVVQELDDVTRKFSIFAKRNKINYFSFFFLILITMLMIPISFGHVIFENVQEPNITAILDAWEILNISFFIVIVVFLVCFPFFLVHKPNQPRCKPVIKHHNIWMLIDVAALFVSNIFLVVIFSLKAHCFNVAMGNELLDKPLHMQQLLLTDTILPIFQSVLQSALLLVCTYRSKFKLRLTGKYMSILILFNLAIWVAETFSTKRDNELILETQVFDRDTWQVYDSTFTPLTIFYRFHSCVYLVKLKADLLKL
jgi:hypothetical protein